MYLLSTELIFYAREILRNISKEYSGILLEIYKIFILTILNMNVLFDLSKYSLQNEKESVYSNVEEKGKPMVATGGY
jgi:hypothetical protein